MDHPPPTHRPHFPLFLFLSPLSFSPSFSRFWLSLQQHSSNWVIRHRVLPTFHKMECITLSPHPSLSRSLSLLISLYPSFLPALVVQAAGVIRPLIKSAVLIRARLISIHAFDRITSAAQPLRLSLTNTLYITGTPASTLIAKLIFHSSSFAPSITTLHQRSLINQDTILFCLKSSFGTKCWTACVRFLIIGYSPSSSFQVWYFPLKHWFGNGSLNYRKDRSQLYNTIFLGFERETSHLME